MNKSDIKLILIVFIISILSILIIRSINNKQQEALVYYDNKLILTIDLSIDKEYEVEGYNGKVVIEVNDNKIRVKDEISPLHLCSKQGYVDSVFEPIICLPNKIVIKLNNKTDIDAIVK